MSSGNPGSSKASSLVYGFLKMQDTGSIYVLTCPLVALESLTNSNMPAPHLSQGPYILLLPKGVIQKVSEASTA